MPSQVTNYKCPACTGPLHFVGASGKLQCDYCGNSYTVDEIDALMEETNANATAAYQSTQNAQDIENSAWDTSGLSNNWGEDTAKLRTYTCPSCGAELICDDTTAATSCPYCGNPTVVPGQFAGALKPELVIPFKLDKNAAIAALKSHYKGRPFLPRSFSSDNNIEKIQGVYVPFWLFDGVVEADLEFEATRSHSRREGNDEVITTEYYRILRKGNVPFEKVPVDASSKMPDDYMDSIEPYYYQDLKPFSTAYLPGFFADRYDVSAKQSAPRLHERCENSAISVLRETVNGYSTCTLVQKNINLQRVKVHYALLPVWLLTTQWQGKSFMFAMNGQTGKMVGDLPTSRGKFWLTFAAITLPLAILMFLFFFF